METREAFQLLTLASARDGRTVDAAVAAVWADDLSDVTLAEAVAVARDHYRESSAWLMPAHIIDRLKSKRRSMLPLTMAEEAPEDCGSHRRLSDGTCLYCTHREFDDAE